MIAATTGHDSFSFPSVVIFMRLKTAGTPNLVSFPFLFQADKRS
jgi:hypothetical protein